MTKSSTLLLSVVVPVYNEAAGIAKFHQQLSEVIGSNYSDSCEVIYVDDGSTDDSSQIVNDFCGKEDYVRLVSLSRNFGKEVATTAGIQHARGQAIVTIDSDGQHPVELIPELVAKWKHGSKIVIGVRKSNHKEGLLKRYGSKFFYWIFNKFTSIKLIPGSTDFRLIDRSVQQEFAKMTERNRITRGLIDWLGYRRDYIYFNANARMAGDAGYSLKKLIRLAIDSVVSLSLSPLYISAYIGAVVLPASILLGLFMFLNAIVGDPARLHATGSAYLVVFILFLVGILLVSQGIIGLYLSHIHTETQNRPLYVVDKEKSIDAS